MKSLRPTHHESFNVLKNNGYHLEHNFGHGDNSLAMTLAAMNLLAFAWHTMLDLLEPPWQTARQAAAKRTSFFAHIVTLTAYVVFPSWRRLPRITRHFHDPAGHSESPKNPMTRLQQPTFRIAAGRSMTLTSRE